MVRVELATRFDALFIFLSVDRGHEENRHVFPAHRMKKKNTSTDTIPPKTSETDISSDLSRREWTCGVLALVLTVVIFVVYFMVIPCWFLLHNEQPGDPMKRNPEEETYPCPKDYLYDYPIGPLS